MVIHHFNRIIKNKWVWGVFAVLISMFFAFDFIFDGRRDTRGSDGAGKLGGETVPTAKFDEVRADVLAEMRFQYGREIPIKAPQLNREVWSRLAMLTVVDDLKLMAGDDEVREAISRSVQDEKGVYSAARFQETCARVGWTPERFEAYIRRQISIGRVRGAAESASWVSPLELSSGVRDATDKITVRVARFQHKNAASVKLDDAALKAYYESHTNSLALPDLTAVRYVKVPADDAESLKKVAITDDDLHARYDETSDRYGTNEFEKVKAQVERELRLERAVEAACDALYARVCPDGAADDGVDRLAQLAKAEKLEVKTSRPFSISGEKFVPGFMVDAATVLPDCRDFVATVSDLDPAEPSARYRAIAGSNAGERRRRVRRRPRHEPLHAGARARVRGDHEQRVRAARRAGRPEGAGLQEGRRQGARGRPRRPEEDLEVRPEAVRRRERLHVDHVRRADGDAGERLPGRAFGRSGRRPPCEGRAFRAGHDRSAGERRRRVRGGPQAWRRGGGGCGRPDARNDGARPVRDRRARVERGEHGPSGDSAQRLGLDEGPFGRRRRR